ncbi:CPBP family intramembrane metalloprotease [Alkalihalobacillus sp. MEB130]|uniref:CPBP family intramembrane glutamic endopeptidase n=1 Tax=Alkalihalobacillus sp. MEB130 TaxID=2976704 RepID=UPI0028E00B11|nr:CPBP family intramembrane glutamic endopeptidase [Alkalihalobacillus sp. MEB130]MDT8862410.1 CPBP family intramembrane metalloprotease [Alkalihalobacillus sp. MEB130]
MNKRYWWILITYTLMQFSAVPGVLLLRELGVSLDRIPGVWSMFSFSVGLLIIILLLIPEMKTRHEIEGRSSRGEAVRWSIIGVFMVFAAQYAAALIEMFLLGIEPGSENTETIVEFAKAFPAFIIVISVIGPILEEIVFRLVIFGALYKRFNFWIAGILSSIIFAAVHMDFTHLLVYTAMGLVFAYLYVKTKRILVPIIAHVAINLFVSIVNVLLADQLEDWMEQLEQLEQTSFIIGGLL